MNREWLRRLAAVKRYDPASQGYELMAYLQDQGFGAPTRQDQLEEEDPADMSDGAEYLLTRSVGSVLEAFCMATVVIGRDQRVAQVAMTWLPGQSTTPEELVQLCQRSIEAVQSWLGPACVWISQGDEWLQDGTPDRAAIASLTWSDRDSAQIRVATPSEYLQSLAAKDTTCSVQFIAQQDAAAAEGGWLLQAIFSS